MMEGMSRVWIRLHINLVKKETGKAFLVLLDSGDEVWLPKSHIREPDELAEGDTFTSCAISEWLANEKGLA